MKKATISVVILHYNDFNMTRDYIDNLRGLNWNDISHQFIIVDNDSPDESGQTLYKNFKGSDDVTVILLPENIGFARGNNKGILYARNELDSELIVVSNNDIDIKTRDFPRLLLKEYKDSQFSVYGPDIYSLSKKEHQNPMREKPMELEEVGEKIKKIDRILPMLYFLNKTGLYDPMKRFKDKVKKNHVKTVPVKKSRIEKCVLHGAFFVLSENYMKEYPDGLFNETFLYMEEDILAFRCNLKGLKMVYDPAIDVIHFDGVSSLHVAGNRCEKFIREMKETRKSCISYMEYMKSQMA